MSSSFLDSHDHIGLDLDETLAGTFSVFLDYAHTREELMMIQDLDDWRTHDLYVDEQYHLDRESLIGLWVDFWRSDESRNIVPLHGALEQMARWQDLGHTLSIITARNGNNPTIRQVTIDWIFRHFPYIPLDQIHFVNHYATESRPKSQVCQDLGITLCIDDHIVNAQDFSDHGISSILLDKPWNQSYPTPSGVIRVDSWEGIRGLN